jgi:hypothetical protein
MKYFLEKTALVGRRTFVEDPSAPAPAAPQASGPISAAPVAPAANPAGIAAGRAMNVGVGQAQPGLNPAQLHARGLDRTQTADVQKGDTLSGIAKRMGVPLANLVAMNPQIKNVNMIQPGQKINLGQAPGSAPLTNDQIAAGGKRVAEAGSHPSQPAAPVAMPASGVHPAVTRPVTPVSNIQPMAAPTPPPISSGGPAVPASFTQQASYASAHGGQSPSAPGSMFKAVSDRAGNTFSYNPQNPMVPNITAAPAPAAPVGGNMQANKTPMTNPPQKTAFHSFMEKDALSVADLHAAVQSGETSVPTPKNLSPMQSSAYKRLYIEMANKDPETRAYARTAMKKILGAAMSHSKAAAENVTAAKKVVGAAVEAAKSEQKS